MNTTPEIRNLEARLVKLEELLMHQQNWLGQLDAVIIQLQNQLAKGDQQIARQIERLQGMIEQRLGGEPLPDEKPPHY